MTLTIMSTPLSASSRPAALHRPAFRAAMPGRLAPRVNRCAHEERQAVRQTAAADRSSALQTAELGLLAAVAAAAPLLLDVQTVSAAVVVDNPLLTGKSVSLLHPLIMFGLLGSSLYTGVLGWKWREARLIPAEIKELKAQLPKAGEDGKVPPSEAGSRIAELEGKRKQLTSGGNLKEKHNNWGSVLLGLGVTFSVLGPVNTYLRTGKLFPGPHLYAGAAITVLWALAASMTPAMAKGNDAARNAHITFNALNVGLFLWQVPTGIEILQKVWTGVPWP